MSSLPRDQPVINTRTVDINHLGTLPEGTFGKEYWHFLQDNVMFVILLFNFR